MNEDDQLPVSSVSASAFGQLMPLWKRHTIEHGAGHYDAITGEFKWNNEVTKEEGK